MLALVAAARSPTWLRFGLVGAATLACWLTSGYFGAMAVITVIAFSVGAALIVRGREALCARRAARSARPCSPAALVAIGSYASGVNAGAGIQREADALKPYGLRPLELVVPAPNHLVFDLNSFWAAAHARLAELHGDQQLPRPAHVRARDRLARRRASPPQRRWLRSRPGWSPRSSSASCSRCRARSAGISMPSKLLWNVLLGVPRALALGSAADDGAAPARRAGLADALSALARRRRWPRRRRRRRWSSRSSSSATHRVAHFRTVPVPPEYAALERDTPDGDPRRVPARLLGHLPPLAARPRPAARERRARGLARRPGAPHGARPGAARNGAETLSLLGVTAIAIHPGGPADTPLQPREPHRRSGLPARRPLPGQLLRLGASWPQPAPALVTLPGGFARSAARMRAAASAIR